MDLTLTLKDKNKTFYEEIDMEVHEHDFKVNER